MNQRIRELARESGLVQYDTDSKMQDVERFAELIVKECCNVLYHNEMCRLMKHFGIHKHVKGKSLRPNPGDVFE